MLFGKQSPHCSEDQDHVPSLLTMALVRGRPTLWTNSSGKGHLPPLCFSSLSIFRVTRTNGGPKVPLSWFLDLVNLSLMTLMTLPGLAFHFQARISHSIHAMICGFRTVLEATTLPMPSSCPWSFQSFFFQSSVLELLPRETCWMFWSLCLRLHVAVSHGSPES